MFVTEREMERAESWVNGWNNQELIKQIKMFENIMEFDSYKEFIFADEIEHLWMFMLQDCARRLSEEGNYNE